MNSFYLEESTGEFRKGRGVDFPHGSPLREAWTFLKSGFGVGLMQFALYIIAVIGLLILFIMVYVVHVFSTSRLRHFNKARPGKSQIRISNYLKNANPYEQLALYCFGVLLRSEREYWNRMRCALLRIVFCPVEDKEKCSAKLVSSLPFCVPISDLPNRSKNNSSTTNFIVSKSVRSPICYGPSVLF